jgi:hypothetical protein
MNVFTEILHGERSVASDVSSFDCDFSIKQKLISIHTKLLYSEKKLQISIQKK